MIRSMPLKRTPFVSEPKPAKGPKTIACRNRACRKRFVPDPLWLRCCSEECGVVIGLEAVLKQKAARERKERRETKLKLIALEPLEYYLKKAERACNAYIRARDAGQGCISCGRHDADVWNAGHFVSVGACGTLRFDPDNIHLQCARPCNKDKGGNIHEYRKGLLCKIGAERVARLDGWHPPAKWNREEVQAIEAHYKAMLRQLKEQS